MSIFKIDKYRIIVERAKRMKRTKRCYIKTIDKNYNYTTTSDIKKAKCYISFNKALATLVKLREKRGKCSNTKFMIV